MWEKPTPRMTSPAPSRLRDVDGVAAGTLALAAVVILWVSRSGFDSFVEPKFAVWSAGVAALMAWGGLRALRGVPLRLAVTPAALAMLACVGWAELSPAWASSEVLPRRALGLWWCALLTLLLVQHAVVVSPRRVGRVALGVLIGVATLVALWAVAEDFGFDRASAGSRLEDWRGNIRASLGNTTHLGDLFGLGLLCALLGFGAARRRAAVLALGGALVVLAAAMIVSFSFHSDVALIAGALVVLAGLGRRRWRRLIWARWRRWALLLALWAGVAGFLFGDVPGNPHRPGLLREALGSERLAWGWGSRLAIWSSSLEMVRLRPLLGWGVGCFTHGYPQQASAWVLDNEDPRIAATAGQWTNAAHCDLLQIWAELGAVGFALWLALLAVHLRACVLLMGRRRRTLQLAGLWLLGLTVMWGVQSLMNFPLQMPVGRLTLVLLLGAAAGLEVASRPDASRWIIPLSAPLRGWRFAVMVPIVLAIAGVVVGKAAVALHVQRLLRAPYERSKPWYEQRQAMLRANAPPTARAQWAQSPLAWEAVEGYQRVLARDAWQRDAVSGLHGMLFMMGEDFTAGGSVLPPDHPQRAALLAEGERLLRASLDAGHRSLHVLTTADVHRNLARAHELLGETDEARRQWLIHFERRPGAARTDPAFEMWMRDEAFREAWIDGEPGAD